ncbi:hypothetical protein [Streptosporangium sp. NPDC002721]|uniref:hypothetical protein n=1 Tax=Streptosporangium sp. NPDC002721 TaxID=3366188 RepID=UPI003677D7C5
MRTAMAAGVLALALGGGIPAVAIVPVSTARASTRTDDCDRGGLLGTVTGPVCQVVDDVVDGLTKEGSPLSPSPLPSGGGAAEDNSRLPAEEAPAETETSQTPQTPQTSAPAPSASRTPSGKKPPATKDTEGSSGGTQPSQPQGPADSCRSVASSRCADPSVAPLSQDPQQPATSTETSRPQASPTPSPSATPSASPSLDQGAAPARKSPVPAPADPGPLPVPHPVTRTLTADVGEPVAPRPSSPVVDAEAPRVELLWPAPLMQELQRQMPEAQPVTPTRSSDTASTVLTTAVLVSTILAVRLLYSRRKIRESIPFEPAPPGHHRVA